MLCYVTSFWPFLARRYLQYNLFWKKGGGAKSVRIWKCQNHNFWQLCSNPESVRTWNCQNLKVSEPDSVIIRDTFRFWPLQDFKNSDTFRFWQIQDFKNSDTFRFWHIQDFKHSDTFRFLKILTPSGSEPDSVRIFWNQKVSASLESFRI